MARLTLSGLVAVTSLLLSSAATTVTATPVVPADASQITAPPMLVKRSSVLGEVKLRCDQKASDQPAACSAFESAISQYLPPSVYAALESDYQSAVDAYTKTATSVDGSALSAGALLTMLPASDRSVVSAFQTAVSAIRSQYSLTGTGYLRPDDVTFVSDAAATSASASSASGTGTGTGTAATAAVSTSSSSSSSATRSGGAQAASSTSSSSSSSSSGAGPIGFKPEAGLLSALLMVLAGLLV